MVEAGAVSPLGAAQEVAGSAAGRRAPVVDRTLQGAEAAAHQVPELREPVAHRDPGTERGYSMAALVELRVLVALEVAPRSAARVAARVAHRDPVVEAQVSRSAAVRGRGT